MSLMRAWPYTGTFFLVLGCSISIAHADPGSTFNGKIGPLLERHCASCHGGETPEADVTLTRFVADPHLWYRVLDQLEHGLMPPEDQEPLATADRGEIIGWIRGELTASLASERQARGRAQFRRLTRAEYVNTIEDLFGYYVDPGLLPKDGRIEGFTKVSAALPMTADGAYGYYQVAQKIVDTHLLRPRPKKDARDALQVTRRMATDSPESAGHYLVLGGGWFASFNTNDSSGQTDGPGPPGPGRYRIRLHAYGYQTDKPLPVGIYTGNAGGYPQQIRLRDIVMVPPGKPAIVESNVFLLGEEGEALGMRPIPLGIGVQVPQNELAIHCKGPGLALNYIEYVGPLPTGVDEWLTADLPEPLTAKLMTDHHAFQKSNGYTLDGMTADEFIGYVRKTMSRIGPRIVRRDLTDAELGHLEAVTRRRIEEEASARSAFLAPIFTLLTSPMFFCVIEPPGALDDFALAARLSLFLWNSAPDDELLAVARAGRLKNPAELRLQTDRMLNDPKADRFVADFVDQWLDLHAINFTTPDKTFYPEYDESLKFCSVRETRGTFAKILRENRSAGDFVAPDWMLADCRLAAHYGLAGAFDATLKTVSLPKDSPYGGLWTQPSILKVTADGSTTSPVKRGVWMAKRLLGTHISPPPPNIEPIQPDITGAKTVREQLALHSSKGACANCHAKFDPYGFALESFDVMGNFRRHYRTVNDGSDAEFRSEVVTPDTPGRMVDIHAPIKGSRELWLVVDPVGDMDWDHADWIEPRLVGPKGELRLATLKGGIKDLKFRTYDGVFNRLPDFDSMKPVHQGSLPKGFIDIRSCRPNMFGAAGDFGVVFTGIANAAQAGQYVVEMASDDGARILIDGKTVVEHDGEHSPQLKTGSVTLTAGDHPIRVEFFGRNLNNSFHARWRGPGSDWAALAMDSMDFKFSTQGWGGVPRLGVSAGGQPTSVDSKPVTEALGTHAPSVIGVDIPEGYETFIAQGGLDDTAASHGHGKVRFLVYTKRPRLADTIEWMDGLPVDPHGTTPDGTDFADIRELRKLLAAQPEKLAWGVTWHLATYATGEPSGPLDRAAIQGIVDSAKNDDYGLGSLVHGVVQSPLFRHK